MKQLTAGDYLSQAALLRLLAVLALVVSPHVLRMPPWIGMTVVALGVWRALAAWRLWPLPPQWLKLMLVVGVFIGVNVTFGRINGQHAGAALLVVMLALKLLEMRSRRDVLVVVSLCYFVMATQFLFSQELSTIPYFVLTTLAVTAVLVEANHSGRTLAARTTLRLAGSLCLQAVPLMAALWVLFPRVPGPLWGLPADAGAGRSGISDTMSPGDISRLIQSDEIAFRVRFDGEPPPMKDRYWRGPVLWYFNGREWRAPFRGDDYFKMYNPGTLLNAYQNADVELLGDPVEYEVTLEPHRQNWLFALDVPSREALPPNSQLTGYYQLVSRELVKELLQYRTRSFLRYRLEPAMAEQWQRSGQRLPDNRNPRAVALGRQWRDEGLAPEEIVNRALMMFREQEFYYTLEPPTLGEETVDEFLFGTRRGFCEHYASSFTVLMRAAGLPARVVVGYQGGERNAVGDYYVVRQSDAHAWSEVWIENRGWLRVDPTAAVAPSRVETGISAALASEELPGFLRRDNSGFWYWRLQADVAWDWVNVMWDRWFLGWNPQRQLDLLSRFGLGDWSRMVLALTAALTGLMLVFGLLTLWRMRALVATDEALRLWRRATRLLAAQGLPQAAYEGPRDYAERVIRERPELAPAVRQLLRAYLDARYYDRQPRAAEAELAEALKALKALEA